MGGSRVRVTGVRTPSPPRDDLRFSNTTGILQKKLWFIGFEVEQEMRAPPPKKNPGSAPVWLVSSVSATGSVSQVCII